MLALQSELRGLPELATLISRIEAVAGIQIARVYSIGAFNQRTGERYDHKVMDRRAQADIHRGHWNTYDDIAEMNETQIAGMVKAYLDNVVDGAAVSLRDVAEKIALFFYEEVRKYPPPRRYIRTFQLQQSHRKQVLV